MNVWTVVHGNVEDSERGRDCGCEVQQAEIYITVYRNEQAAGASPNRMAASRYSLMLNLLGPAANLAVR